MFRRDRISASAPANGDRGSSEHVLPPKPPSSMAGENRPVEPDQPPSGRRILPNPATACRRATDTPEIRCGPAPSFIFDFIWGGGGACARIETCKRPPVRRERPQVPKTKSATRTQAHRGSAPAARASASQHPRPGARSPAGVAGPAASARLLSWSPGFAPERRRFRAQV